MIWSEVKLVNVYTLYYTTFVPNPLGGLLGSMGFETSGDTLFDIIQIDSSVIFLKLHILAIFCWGILNAIAVALSVTLVVHPANKK